MDCDHAEIVTDVEWKVKKNENYAEKKKASS